jgi:hypothetical protein
MLSKIGLYHSYKHANFIHNYSTYSGSTKTAERKGEMAIGLFYLAIYVIHTEYATGLTNDSSIGRGGIYLSRTFSDNNK